MALDDGLHDLILRIHRTAAEGGSFAPVAQAAAERLGAYGVTTVLHRTDRPEILASAMAGYRDLPFDGILQDYAAHFHAHNPQALFERARPDALYYLDGEDPRFSPEAYPEFSRWEADRIGIRHHATGYCRPVPALTYAFAFSGSAATGPLSGERLALFHVLMAHLREAVATAHRLGTLGRPTPPDRTLETLLAGLPTAAATLDATGRVVFANAALSALAKERDGLLLAGETIRAMKPAENDRLRALCAAAADLWRGPDRGGVLAVSRPSGQRPYAVRVSPLPPLPGRGAAAVLVTATDLAKPPRLRPDRLATLLGLTPAEARVAAGLFAAGRLETVAEGCGVTMATLRTQLKHIYAKTATAGQAELVALLARLPQDPFGS